MDQDIETPGGIFFPKAKRASVGVGDIRIAAESNAAVAQKQPDQNLYRKLALSVQKLEAPAHEVAQRHKACRLTRNSSSAHSIGYRTLTGEPQREPNH